MVPGAHYHLPLITALNIAVTLAVVASKRSRQSVEHMFVKKGGDGSNVYATVTPGKALEAGTTVTSADPSCVETCNSDAACKGITLRTDGSCAVSQSATTVDDVNAVTLLKTAAGSSKALPRLKDPLYSQTGYYAMHPGMGIAEGTLHAQSMKRTNAQCAEHCDATNWCDAYTHHGDRCLFYKSDQLTFDALTDKADDVLPRQAVPAEKEKSLMIKTSAIPSHFGHPREVIGGGASITM